MLKKAKLLYALSLVLLLAGPQALAQSKFKQTIKSIFHKEEPVEAYEIPVHLLMPKDRLYNISYKAITGNTLDELYADIYSEIGYVPEVSIPTPDKGTKYEGTFNIAEYTREVQREEEEDDEDDIDYSDTPEEYNIWTNASINPYNVKLSEMTDTVRIDISSYTSPGYKYVTSEFGGRWGRLHAGIDLKVFIGDTIRSAFDNGVVRISKFNKRGYGYYVVVRHDNGLETLYGHMSKILVEEGQHLKAGEPVGLGGSTGRSTGPHLHFELRYLGNPINPRDAIDFNTGKINDKTLVLTKDNFRYQNQKFSKKSKGRKGTASKGKGKKGKGKATKGSSGGKTVTVRKGDTLGAIARRNGTTVAKIQKLNGLKGTLIRAGQKLRVR
ncbi:MAG: peptidoglycan DD-metalloendopeptidase family protein [Bacteroidales bacterium]|nr:peptidoglycan DD-metalloendopeptidase family protein [Bacteroidales bacterium]